MCTDAGEGLGLVAKSNVLLEMSGLVDAIVAAVVTHMDIVRASKLLKLMFGLDGLDCVGGFLMTAVNELR